GEREGDASDTAVAIDAIRAPKQCHEPLVARDPCEADGKLAAAAALSVAATDHGRLAAGDQNLAIAKVARSSGEGLGSRFDVHLDLLLQTLRYIAHRCCDLRGGASQCRIVGDQLRARVGDLVDLIRAARVAL